MATAALISRTVQSNDPSLSDEANRLLTDELRKVLGRDEVDLPVGRSDHRADRHATHSSLVAAGISVRMEVVLVGLVVAMATFIAIAMATENWWLTGVAYVLLFPTTIGIAWGVMRLFSEPEHLGPEIAAQLSAEGVGDPDHVFNELLHDFETAAPAR